MTTVTPIEHELLRFHVESSSRPGTPHLVDLSEYDMNGACDCDDFKYRKMPRLERGERSEEGTLVCRHITAARDYLISRFLPALNKRAEEPQQADPAVCLLASVDHAIGCLKIMIDDGPSPEELEGLMEGLFKAAQEYRKTGA